MKNSNVQTIDDYLSSYPKNAKNIANELRAFIKHRAENVTENIKQGKPTLYLGQKIIQFIIHDDHIGFFPGKGAIEKFKNDFEVLGFGYNSVAVRFSIYEKLPYTLIENIINFIKIEDIVAANEKSNHKSTTR